MRCVKVEMAVLGSPSLILIVLMVFVDVYKATFEKEEEEFYVVEEEDFVVVGLVLPLLSLALNKKKQLCKLL